MSRPFVKMHGLRNHFVIFDRRIDRRGFSTEDIVRICDSQVGVGNTIETGQMPEGSRLRRLGRSASAATSC